MKKKTFYLLALAFTFNIAFFSCSEDEFTESILPDTRAELDPTSYSYKFDKWLQDEYLDIYNLDFRYKMQDAGTDMDYNLVPTTYRNAQDIALLAKYLWFDVYGKVVNPDFLKEYGPRIIHLIGSPAFNPTDGTMILGLAEGGIKVSLYRCNDLNATDVNMMNEYYFKTMHHEFGHILHQTKSYPSEFNLISNSLYNPLDWQNTPDSVAASLGFVSNYASSATREDFVEVIANYIVKTDAQWAGILKSASMEWTYDKENHNNPNVQPADKDKNYDGVDGETIILRKLEICRKWLKESFGIDLDALRKEVQERQAKINQEFMEELRKQIDEVPVPSTAN